MCISLNYLMDNVLILFTTYEILQVFSLKPDDLLN